VFVAVSITETDLELKPLFAAYTVAPPGATAIPVGEAPTGTVAKTDLVDPLMTETVFEFRFVT
jgi:hypothetical protein